MNPHINRLVQVEGMLDTTAGSYRFPKDLPYMEELNWVFEPYFSFALSGQIDKRDCNQFRNVILSITDRIIKHVSPSSNQRRDFLPLDTRYEVLKSFNGWSLINEIGLNSRLGLYSDGINAFVSYRKRPDGRYTYCIGKASPYYKKFDLIKIFRELNTAEKATLQPSGFIGFGGGYTTGGSDRVLGSSLNPDTVSETIHKSILTS